MALTAIVLLASCDHNVTTETIVYPDGRLDKIFIFENKDSSRNVVGLRRGNGWSKTVVVKDVPDTKVKDDKFIATFKKSFASAEEANQELATADDSLLRITSSFDKKFRWFYTHIRYSETIHPLNNNLHLKSDDFVVKEDYAFIDRLPAEGKALSKGDEFYLSELNTRIVDNYGTRAYFEEYYAIGRDVLGEQQLEKKWLDTLEAHKENLFRKMQSGEKDMKDNYLPDAMDSLGIPLDKVAFVQSAKRRNQILEDRLNFISSASEGKFKHIIHLPWEVIETNADSTSGKTIVWAPPSIKFLLKDYTMYGECRKPNYSLWALSGATLLLIGYLLVRRSISQSPRQQISK